MTPVAGIQDLGCIGECMNLERLDLTGNNITNLAALSSLRHLSVLNLSANKISSLGGLSMHIDWIDSVSVCLGCSYSCFFFCTSRALAQL